jgi:DNA polymerase-3 subunit delta'
MSLGAIIGHRQALRILRRAFLEERLPTAYLFLGPPNVGKFTLAQQFAKLLNCHNLQHSKDPDAIDCCDECFPCRRIEAGNFPDVLAVKPVVRVGKGAQAEATEFEGAVLTTDQIGEIITRAGLKLSRGKHKVLIVSRAETMNAEAANRLLKTLEEPPPRTTIILTSANPSGLLPTTVSRCQKVAFHPVPLDELRTGLADRCAVGPQLMETVAKLSAGRVGWAITVLNSPNALTVRQQLLQLILQLPSQPPVSSLAMAEELIRLAERWWLALNSDAETAEDVLARSGDRVRRVAMTDLLDLVASVMRDVLLLTAGNRELVLNTDFMDGLETLAARTTPEGARRAAAGVEQVQRHLRGNANLRLACELLLLQVMQTYRVAAEV